MWEVLLDALLDTLKLVPLLLAAHVLIELLEHGAIAKIKLSKALKGPIAPLFGAGVGLLPQCGFSVVAAKLYSKRHITLGTLLAVFVATSDEAIPILLASPSSAVKLLPLLGIKLLAALFIGYGVSLVTVKRERERLKDFEQGETVHAVGCHGHELIGSDEKQAAEEYIHGEHNHKEHTRAEHSSARAEHSGGAASETRLSHSGSGIAAETSGQDVVSVKDGGGESAGAAKKAGVAETLERYVWHPMLHTLTVTLYVLIVNVALGTIVYFVTEQRLAAFMESSRLFQPLLSALVGLIPNCASSVAITGLYASGALNLGGAVAGLCVNAGLGLAVLFKENAKMKENVVILTVLFAFGVILGTGIELITGALF